MHHAAAAAISNLDATTIQRMPPIMDFNFLPDMGRIDASLSLAARAGCSPIRLPARRPAPQPVLRRRDVHGERRRVVSQSGLAVHPIAARGNRRRLRRSHALEHPCRSQPLRGIVKRPHTLVSPCLRLNAQQGIRFSGESSGFPRAKAALKSQRRRTVSAHTRARRFGAGCVSHRSSQRSPRYSPCPAPR